MSLLWNSLRIVTPPTRYGQGALTCAPFTGSVIPGPEGLFISLRCAIWARVSQDSGNQFDALRAEAARRGVEVPAEYVPGGLPAWSGAHREQLREALSGARAGRVEVLVVWGAARPARDSHPWMNSYPSSLADLGNESC